MSDEHQPVKLIFDTGSDYLAVTSSLCSDPKYLKEGQLSQVVDKDHIDAEQWNGDVSHVQLSDITEEAA